MKYVIIGASAAGLAAAEQIRKTDPAGVVTLLTRETDLPYSVYQLLLKRPGAAGSNALAHPGLL